MIERYFHMSKNLHVSQSLLYTQVKDLKFAIFNCPLHCMYIPIVEIFLKFHLYEENYGYSKVKTMKTQSMTNEENSNIKRFF